jgi:hypothetical protein
VIDQKLPIVKVRIKDSEWHYYTIEPLKVGDMVDVPTKFGHTQGTVTAVDVPESDIAAFKDKMRVIPPLSVIEESWKDIKPLGPIIDTRSETEKEPDKLLDFYPDPEPTSTAVIIIQPETNLGYIALKESLTSLLSYAQVRVIKTDADLIPATNDLTVIAKCKKELKTLSESYIKPIKSHLDAVRDAFNTLTVLLQGAETINKAKMDAYTEAQRLRAVEIAEVNRQAEEVSRKQAELNQGVFTVDTTPIPAPPPPVKHIRTEGGTASIVNKPADWEIEDPAKMDLIPKEYWMLDEVKIGRVIRAGGTIPNIKKIHRTGVSVTTR